MFILLLLTLTTLPAFTQTCHESGSEPHAMAPIGVMGGHTHSKGHFMATYRYMLMNMNGMSSQGTSFSSEEILQNSMMTPTQMTMQMHMIGLMYAPHDRVTLMAMSSYRTNSMGMESEMGHGGGGMDHSDHSPHAMHGSIDMDEEPMQLESTNMYNHGLGDTKITALVRLNKSPDHCLHALVGASLPTGSVDAGDDMHPILPYGMQNGTGSVGAQLGLNYSWIMPKYLIGTQALSSAPLHENKRGFMGSVKHDASIWVARKWTSWMSTSLRGHGHYQTGIRGSDPLINAMMSPAGNGANEALAYTDASLGFNLRPFDQIRVGLEAGYLIYQYNQGSHLDNQWTVTAGIQFMVH